MDGDLSKGQKAFNEMEATMKKMLATQKQLETGLGKYFEIAKDIQELEKNIAHLSDLKIKNTKAINDETAELKTLEADLNAAITKGDNSQIKAAKEKLKLRKKSINLLLVENKLLDDNIVELQKGTKALREAVKESNKLKAAWGSMKGLGNFAKNWGFDKLKTYGVFEMDKEIRNAARSMNIGKKDFQSFADNINKASESTTQWGVGTKRLAVMQRNYSEEVGKSVQLTQEGYKSMALMAEGTGLGDEFATSMAASMDTFGGSAETAKDLVQETMNSAGKMGVNGVASLKKMQKLLQLSQTYVFKGGIKGLKTMAADAARLKLDMDGIAGLADKVMRPEGAVETAALLTTMGGEFAKLGDPFQLMFKARNDFEGFAKDIGKASAEFVKYNEETKTFDIAGGLARDRMKEISNITGIAMDKLQEMAGAQKKIEMIGAELAPGFTDEDKKLIGTLSQIGKNGEITVKAGSFEKNIKELKAGDIKTIQAEEQLLEKRAEQARTFAEVIDDLVLTFQQLLLPVAQSLKDNLGVPLQNLMNDWSKNGYYDSLKSFIKTSADFVLGIGKWAIKIAEYMGPTGILATWGALKIATWLANGAALGQGFKMVTSGMFGGGGAGSSFNNTMTKGGYTRNPQTGQIMPMSTMQKMSGKFQAGSMGSVGLSAGLGVAGVGLDIARSGMAEPDSGGGKAMGIGADILKYGAMGALAGPWGALIGGALGAGIGTYQEFFSEEAKNKAQGKLAPTIPLEDGIIKFHKNDKFLSVNDALIAGTNAGGNAKLAEAYAGSSSMQVGGNVSIDGTVNVEFPGGSAMGMLLANDIPFMRRIVEGINEQMAKNGGGGVTASKPNPLNIK
jgi:hypothetical protein